MAERRGGAGEMGAELVAYGRGLLVIWPRWQDGLLWREQCEQFRGLLRQRVELTLTAGAHCGHPATEPTCQNLLERKEALWTFIATPGVDPTNNAAERALRGPVIRRKLSLGTQSTRGHRLIERLSTVVATCRQHVGLCSLICARPSKPFCSVAPLRLGSLCPLPN